MAQRQTKKDSPLAGDVLEVSGSVQKRSGFDVHGDSLQMMDAGQERCLYEEVFYGTPAFKNCKRIFSAGLRNTGCWEGFKKKALGIRPRASL
jgi:hypothetical protein